MDKSGTSHIARALRGESGAGEPLARGFRLVSWRVRPDLCTIESGGRSIQLEPKTMGVLLGVIPGLEAFWIRFPPADPDPAAEPAQELLSGIGP